MKKLTATETAALNRLQAKFTDDEDTIAWAEYINQHHSDNHRGASENDDSFDEIGNVCHECLVFGNDCFETDSRSQIEVALLALKFDELGIEITGFGIDPTGQTWVMKALHEDQQLLKLLVWNAWFEACGGEVNPVKEEFDSRIAMMEPSCIQPR